MKKAKVGRKKLDDKKELVGIYIRKSDIDLLGGTIELREMLLQYVESEILKLKQ